jgi:hypothetical protein
MEDSSESMNIIYDAESLLSHLDTYLTDEKNGRDYELSEFVKIKEKLEAKIEKKENELEEEEDETEQINLKYKIDELEDDLNSMIKEEEAKREVICHYESLIDDVYTVTSRFSRAIHDGVTTGKYNENMEAYIMIRSTEMNTALTNIFHEDTNIIGEYAINCYDSDIFEEFEVVDVEMDAEEDIEEEGEEHIGDVDEDGFQRFPEPDLEDVNNNDDDPSSDDESDDPSTEEEIKEDNEKKEFIVKNGFNYCGGCKSSICICLNEDEDEEDDVTTSVIIALKRQLNEKDNEIEKLKALLKIYIK